MRRRGLHIRGRAGRGAVAATVAAAALLGAAPARADVVHTTVPGESLSSIAAVNGMSAETIAAANGLSSDTELVIGQEVAIPAVSAIDPAAQGMIVIHHPSAAPYLAPDAAAAWEAMRQHSLASYGVDLYPIGPQSGYRSYAQQSYFYDLYLSGLGNPANPPGTSSHESGYAVDLATPAMRDVIDEIGAEYGWAKVEAPSEWWHVNYVGGY